MVDSTLWEQAACVSYSSYQSVSRINIQSFPRDETQGRDVL